MYKVYVLQRIRDGATWRAGTVIHALARCKGWRVLKWYWAGHGRGGGLQ